MDKNTKESLFYTPEELVENRILPLGRTGVYRGLKDGTIPSIRVGKKYIVPRSALLRWLESAGGLQEARA